MADGTMPGRTAPRSTSTHLKCAQARGIANQARLCQSRGRTFSNQKLHGELAAYKVEVAHVEHNRMVRALPACTDVFGSKYRGGRNTMVQTDWCCGIITFASEAIQPSEATK